MSAGGGLEAVAVLLPSVPVSVKEKQQLWDQFLTFPHMTRQTRHEILEIGPYIF